MEHFNNTSTEAATPSDSSLVGTNVVTLRDVVRILRRRAPIALLTFAVTVAAALYVTSKMAPTYEASTTLLLDNAQPAAVPSNVLDLLSARGGASSDVEVEKIKSRAFVSEVARRAGLVGKVDIDDLKNRIQPAITDGQLMQIKVTMKNDAPMTAKVANTTAEVYKEYVRQDDERKLALSSQRLERAAKKAEQEKNQAQRAVFAFQEQVRSSDPNSLFVARAAKTQTVRDSLENAERDLPLQEKQVALFANQVNTIPPTIVGGTSRDYNGMINQFKNELVSLDADRKLKLNDFGEQSLEVQEIDAKIKATKEALAQAESDPYRKSSVGISRNPDYSTAISGLYTAKREVVKLRDLIGAYRTQLASLQSEQTALAPQRARFQELQQRLEVATNAYRQANNALLQIPITRITNVPNIRTLEPARVPQSPVSPKPMLNLIMAIFGGTFLALAVAIGTEYFASSPQSGHNSLPAPGQGLPQLPAVPFAHSLPSVSGVPLLARVPVAGRMFVEANGAGIGQIAAAHAATEDAFREIGYLLSHATETGRVPVVLMAGTRTDETTASVAASLTATLVREGMRVTLVDGDRAEPRLHKVFGKPDAPGVTDILAGHATVTQAIHTGANGNLRFLAAGAKADQTPLTEEALRRLYDELGRAGDTDLVIVSGPSVWSARLVSPMEKAADGIVLVASDAQVAPEESVARARRILTNGYQPRLLGVIVGEETVPAEASALPAPNPAEA